MYVCMYISQLNSFKQKKSTFFGLQLVNNRIKPSRKQDATSSQTNHCDCDLYMS